MMLANRLPGSPHIASQGSGDPFGHAAPDALAPLGSGADAAGSGGWPRSGERGKNIMAPCSYCSRHDCGSGLP